MPPARLGGGLLTEVVKKDYLYAAYWVGLVRREADAAPLRTWPPGPGSSAGDYAGSA